MSNAGSTQLDSPGAGGIYAPMAVESAADWYVQQARNEGWYVGQGCQIVASGTAGKVDMSAGTILIGSTEVAVVAVTAFATTITTLASGLSSGQALWVACEVDVSGTLNFNAGAGAQSDTTHTPVKPTPTSARVVVAWLFVPYGATTVDANLGSASNAKILEARQLVPGLSPTGWQYEQGTWVYGSATKFAVAGDQTAKLRACTFISYNDGAVDYGAIGTSSVSATNTAVSSSSTPSSDSKLNKTAHTYVADQAVVVTGLSGTTGLTNGGLYFISATGLGANAFRLAATIGGTAISLAGTQDTNITVTGATVVSLIPNDDYSIANATLLRPRFTYGRTAQGLPGQFNFAVSVVLTGFSMTSLGCFWYVSGSRQLTYVLQGAAAASTATAHTATLPWPGSITVWCPAFCYDNSAAIMGVVAQFVSATLNIYAKITTLNNTASLNSLVDVTYTYPI